jgi:hypothetical protein
MATTDECIEFALKNIGLWWRYGISRHCDEWKYIIIGRIIESEIILIPPSLKISESSSNGSYRNTDEVWWRYGISRSCDECVELDSRHPLLPKAGWGKWRFDWFFREKNVNFCRYKCFQCWCKGEKHENKQNYNC